MCYVGQIFDEDFRATILVGLEVVLGREKGNPDPQRAYQKIAGKLHSYVSKPEVWLY